MNVDDGYDDDAGKVKLQRDEKADVQYIPT
jgi:hypothetical protein